MPPLRSGILVGALLAAVLPQSSESTAPLCPGASCFSPPGGDLDAAAFAAFLTARSSAGDAALALAPGSYAVAAPARGAHLSLPALANVELFLSGVTLTCADRHAAGVYAGGWANASFVGPFDLRWAAPPSNSAVVLSLDAASSSMTVAVEAGHPTEDFDASTVRDCNVFEPSTRLRRPMTWDVSLGPNISKVGDRTYNVSMPNWGQLARVQVGDGLGCRVPGGGMTFQMDGARNVTVSGVTLYGGGCFGVLESGGGGNSWRNVTITYPDPPPGAATRPLLSTSADGFHSVGTRVGPQIDGFVFEGMDDDGIAIHGSFSLVTDAAPAPGGAGGGQVWVADHGQIAAGDRLALFDLVFAPAPAPAAPGFEPTAWTVASVERAAPGYTPPANASKTMPSQLLPSATFSVLTLAGAPLPSGVGFDWVLTNLDAVGSGYSIRNSVIRNHRARGLLLKGTNGHVENVSITNSSLGGIIVTPELYWEEATFSRNVTIVRNTVTLTSSGMQSYGGLALGAVAPNGRLATAPGHVAISIIDNVLVDCGYSPVWLNAAGNVTFAGNRIVAPFHAANASDLPSCCEPLPAQRIAVYAQSVRGLSMSGNCVQPAPAGESSLEFLFNATADCDGDFVGGVSLC